MRHRHLFLVCSLAIALLFAARATAAPVVMQNDSIVDNGQAAIQTGFVAEEKGAAWLTSTCSGNVIAVQILWLSLTGGAGDSLGESIEIFLPGTFPNPGTRIRELVGPVLTDGFFNQFIVSPSIAILQGETLVVSFKFFSNPPLFGPSLATDTNGCQAGKNAIFAIPPSQWFSACALGVSGDIAIRMVVDCPVEDPEIFSDGFASGDTSAWSATVDP